MRSRLIFLTSLFAAILIAAFCWGLMQPKKVSLRWQQLYEPGSGGWITSIAASPHEPKRVLMGGDLLGVGLSLNLGESWEPTFGFLSWEVAEFTWHPKNPKVVWVGTMSGPHISVDGGKNWKPMRNGLPPVSDWHYSAPVEKVLFDPNNPLRLIAVGGSQRRYPSPGEPMWGAVWESTDGGQTWRLLSVIKDEKGKGRNIVAAAFAAGSSTRIYAAVDGFGVFVSDDGGKTWTPRNQGLPHTNVNDLAVHPTDPNTIWVALGNWRPEGSEQFVPGGVYKSTDGGQSWRPVTKGMDLVATNDPNLTSRFDAIAVAPSNPKILVTCDTAWNRCITYKSVDGGESWFKIFGYDTPVDRAYPAGPGMTVIAFDPKNENVIFMAGSEYAVRSLDGGKTWTDVTSRRINGGWRGRGYSGLCATNVKFNPFKPKHIVILALDQGFWQSKDGGLSWTTGKGMPNWEGRFDVTFAGEGGQVMFVTRGQFGHFGGILKSTDGGENWTLLAGKKHGLPELGERQQPISIHAASPQTVWATIGGRLYRTDNGGESWRIVHEGPGLNWIAPTKPLARSFYVAGDSGVYFTPDGERFQLLDGGPKPATFVTVDPSNPERIYVTSWRQAGGLWRWEKGEWAKLHDDRFIYKVAVHPRNPKRLVVATNDHPYHDRCFSTGVWVSEDGGKTWKQANDGLPCLRIECIAFNPHDPTQLVCGTLGLGFFAARWK
ncbi:MAG: YCF48-related protein [Armatimonadetes bacterium]|nr:YCF48-related protein [Armatimonadota bacterium]